MLVFNKKRIVEEKIQRLQDGYSAFAETQEVARLIKQEISSLNMTVHEDETEFGCWFIPERG